MSRKKKLFSARSSIKIKKQFKEGSLVGGSTHIEKISVKMVIFPNFRSENSKNKNKTTT